MRILLTVHQFFPQFSAGTEVLTYSVAKELILRGHEVHVYTGHNSTKELLEIDRFDEYDYEEIHVYRFHHAYIPMGGGESMIGSSYDNPLAERYFKQILKRFQPDIVHFFHLNRLGTRLIDAAVLENIRVFMTPTDFWTICPTGQLVLSNGQTCSGPNKFAGNCIKHVAQSSQNNIISKLADWLPIFGANLLAKLSQSNFFPPYRYREEVRGIYNRLDINISRLNKLNGLVVPNDFMANLFIQQGIKPELIIKSEFGINIRSKNLRPRSYTHKPLRIGFIGTLVPHKGCHVLIEAFKLLPSGQAVLKIYGNLNEYPDYISSLKNSADNISAIEFCGTFNNSEIQVVLSNLDVLVVPSLWFENTPLVIYSAQAEQCPVIGSNYPGIASVIENEANGLLFEPGNVQDLALKLSRLIYESALFMRLSKNARRPKSIENYVNELLDIWLN